MFPKTLDDARVLYYTSQEDYGPTFYTTGEIEDYIKYLAICSYENTAKEEYYLFKCNEKYEVLRDTVWDSIEECMNIANTSYKIEIKWVKAES